MIHSLHIHAIQVQKADKISKRAEQKLICDGLLRIKESLEATAV